jgi:hypothetical protein
MEYEYKHANGTTASLSSHCKRDLEWVFKSDVHYWCSLDREKLHRRALELGYILTKTVTPEPTRCYDWN